MAREAKKDPNELTVEQKLKTLFQLQTMVKKPWISFMRRRTSH